MCCSSSDTRTSSNWLVKIVVALAVDVPVVERHERRRVSVR